MALHPELDAIANGTTQPNDWIGAFDAVQNFIQPAVQALQPVANTAKELGMFAQHATLGDNWLNSLKSLPYILQGQEVPQDLVRTPEQSLQYRDKGMNELVDQMRSHPEELAMNFMPGAMGYTSNELKGVVGDYLHNFGELKLAGPLEPIVRRFGDLASESLATQKIMDKIGVRERPLGSGWGAYTGRPQYEVSFEPSGLVTTHKATGMGDSTVLLPESFLRRLREMITGEIPLMPSNFSEPISAAIKNREQLLMRELASIFHENAHPAVAYLSRRRLADLAGLQPEDLMHPTHQAAITDKAYEYLKQGADEDLVQILKTAKELGVELPLSDRNLGKGLFGDYSRTFKEWQPNFERRDYWLSGPSRPGLTSRPLEEAGADWMMLRRLFGEGVPIMENTLPNAEKLLGGFVNTPKQPITRLFAPGEYQSIYDAMTPESRLFGKQRPRF